MNILDYDYELKEFAKDVDSPIESEIVSFFKLYRNSKTYIGLEEYQKTKRENVLFLDLSKQNIKKIPDDLKKMINLKALDLSENPDIDLNGIGEFKNLQVLFINNCKLSKISDEIEHLTGLFYLNINNNSISIINERIEQLNKIVRLELSNNKIIDISVLNNLINLIDLRLMENQIFDISPIENLNSLIKLDLSYNQISDISFLKNLNKIKYLYLSANRIYDISILKDLKNLDELYLDSNSISDISPIKDFYNEDITIFETDNNPLKFPPIEIVKLGDDTINEYFEHCEQGTSVLREAKLIIIGEAGAGKTTFAKKLLNPNASMPKPEETTLGIDIFNWSITDNDLSGNLKLWDFGGQDIYHGTHQFFFSEKSLYVLIADTREQKADFNYWLNTVEQLTGEDSPLIILLNKKQKHNWQIDEPGLKRRFGQIIKKVITVDLSLINEVIPLQDIIKKNILNLPHIGYTLPTFWVEIRNRLSQLNDKFIKFDKFRDICKEVNITNPKVQEIICKLFTNIGVFTHFPGEDSSLQDIIFLDSNWLTKIVYLLLNNENVKNKQGRITIQEIKEIWNEDEIYFERHRFIDLLKKFSLIYKINGSDNFIVPEHLPMIQPYDNWPYDDKDDVYQFRYKFDSYMPKGIMPRLIVALHPYIKNNDLVWHRGINIVNSIEKPDTYAEILETYGRENRFDIRIHGKKQKEMLNLIIHHFDRILQPFKKLTHEKEIPCYCDTCKSMKTPFFHRYSQLQKASDKGVSMIQCGESFESVDVEKLLSGISYTKLRSLLLNEKFSEFEKLISEKFSDISYQIYKEKVSESSFHNVLHTILAENGLRPVSEEGTNNGRIDIHLTIGNKKYLFELKKDSTPADAIQQIKDKKYYRKFESKFKNVYLIGVNFSTKLRNIDGIAYEVINNN